MIRRSLAFAFVCTLAASAAQAQSSAQAEAAPAAAPVAAEDQLQIIDTVVGTGKEAIAGTNVHVNYTGWLFKPLAAKQHGKQFDSSLDAGRTPLVFPLGKGAVIKGWDQGVAGMKVGGKRTLIIPSAMAYCKKGAGGVIPPDAPLIFDVELLDVK